MTDSSSAHTHAHASGFRLLWKYAACRPDSVLVRGLALSSGGSDIGRCCLTAARRLDRGLRSSPPRVWFAAESAAAHVYSTRDAESNIIHLTRGAHVRTCFVLRVSLLKLADEGGVGRRRTRPAGWRASSQMDLEGRFT